MKNITYQNTLNFMCILCILFIMCLFISIKLHVAEKFFAVMASLNVITLIVLLLFKNKILDLVTYVQTDYEIIKNKPTDHSIKITYYNETLYGSVLIVPVILIGIYMIQLSISDPKLYRYTIQEDGLIEYSSAICWFLAILFTSFDYIRGKVRNEKCRFIVNPSVALLIFYVACAGEELSWGQRWFGVATPELISKVNVQNEINLHNIGSISIFSNLFFIITLIFFLIVPLTARHNLHLKNYLCQYSIPIPNRFVTVVYLISLLIWIVIGVRFGTLGFHPFSFYAENYHTQMDDEIFEFLAAYSFMAFSIMSCLKEKAD